MAGIANMRRFSALTDPVIAPIKQRLDDFRQQRRVQAGSLIISAFGDAIVPRGGRIWLGSLIRLLEPLELNERLIRTSVFRLAKEEWLRTETVGRRADYVLTNPADSVSKRRHGIFMRRMRRSGTDAGV
jgi:DNA-binding transcriptional regulator PaaX